MQLKDPSREFKDALTLLARLHRESVTNLDLTARSHGVAIKSSEEEYKTYIARIWKKLTSRTDYELVYATYSFVNAFKPSDGPAQAMRDRITRHVKANLDELKVEEEKGDRDFLRLLKTI